MKKVAWIAVAKDPRAAAAVPPERLAEARAALPMQADEVLSMLPTHPVVARCRLCGRRALLTREHLPPRSAHNNAGGVVHTITEWLARSALDVIPGGEPQDDGIWGYTLCRRCNNETGGLYGTEYKMWANTAIDFLKAAPSRNELDKRRDLLGLHARVGVPGGARPGALVRQALAIMCSLSGWLDLAGTYPAIRRIVLDRSVEPMPNGMVLNLALYYGPLVRLVGPALEFDTATFDWRWVMELAYPPLALLMTLASSGAESPLFDISQFTQIPYDRNEVVECDLLIGLGHTAYPGDYRPLSVIDHGDVSA